MRESLILQPIHNSSTDILRSFATGKPLSGDQINFLDWHQKELSSPSFDPVLRFYLQLLRKRARRYHASFLLPHEELNFADIEKLKKRIQIFLKEKASQVTISLTEKQLLKFKELTSKELLFWHGNQFLTGAPFFPGGIPPVIFFQWGNLFGVVKYVILPGEKALKTNILIYFEDMQDRYLDQCVLDYNQHLENEIKLQKETLINHPAHSPAEKLENKEIPEEKPEEKLGEKLEPVAYTHTPRLTLTPYYLIDKLDK